MSTIEKALELLGHFSSARPEIGLSEFKRITQLDKGTLHRHLTALRNSGFLEQNPGSRAYRLGPALIRLAIVREATVPLVNTVRVYVDQIAAATHELAHAAVPDKAGMSTIYVVDGGARGTRVRFDESEVLPYHATSSGIAMLAHGPAALRERALDGTLHRFTRHTPQNKAAVTKWIDDTQACGFALTNQFFETEVSSAAVPFFGPEGAVIGTLAIATPSSRMTDAARDRMMTILATASTDLSQNLGGQVPAALSETWALHQGAPA